MSKKNSYFVERNPAGTAPWPWRNVIDELRLLPDGTVIALTFGLPLMPGGGSPFLLRREG